MSEQSPGNQPQYGQQPPSYGQQPPYGGQPPAYGTAGPQGEMSPADQRQWGMLAHLSALAGMILTPATGFAISLGAVGPLIIFLVLKERGLFVRRQALEALNFQILVTAVYLAGVVLTVATFGLGIIVTLPLGLVLAVIAVIFTIIASVKANQGIDYRYPLSWRLVK